jgi:hypothetical protein
MIGIASAPKIDRVGAFSDGRDGPARSQPGREYRAVHLLVARLSSPICNQQTRGRWSSRIGGPSSMRPYPYPGRATGRDPPPERQNSFGGDLTISKGEQARPAKRRSDRPGDIRHPRRVRTSHVRLAKSPPVAKNARYRFSPFQGPIPKGMGVERAHDRGFPSRLGRRCSDRRWSHPDQRSNVASATSWRRTDCGGDDDHVPIAAGPRNIMANRR